MNRKQARIVGGAAAAVIAVLVVLIVLAQKRPASCDPQLRAQADALHKTGLAIVSVTKAEQLVDTALTRADLVDTHFFLFRRYDVKACDDARSALTQAQSAVAEATKNKAALAGVFSAREAALASAQRALDSATQWIATGLADTLVDERRAAKEKLDDERAKLERASGEAKSSGFENVDHARVGADANALDVDALRVKARDAVLAKCGLKDLGFQNVRTAEEWLVVDDGASTNAAVAVVDSDATTPTAPKKCSAVVRAMPKGVVGTPGEQLFSWAIPGALVTTKWLVGWSPTSAWFVSRDGAVRSFHHAAKCAKLECPQPTHDDRALSAKCTCDDRIVETRYAFDGHTINYEP